jgi:hypothetical protein
MSIFVSIASYSDPLLGFTIERARANARHPDQLHFGVVEQAPTATPMPQGASYVRVDPGYARGPCWARAIAMSFYRGEDWFLQIDSHMDFAPGWDEQLVAQARALRDGRNVVLTTYPSAFVFEDGKPVPTPITSKVLALVVTAAGEFKGATAVLPFVGTPVESDEPVPGFHVGAGCLFASGNFALEIPYDPSLYFHGEEQAVSLRLYTRGWDIYHPPGMPIYHLYNDASSHAPSRPMHWDSNEEAGRAVKWNEFERRSQQRLLKLVAGSPLGAYGLGVERTLAQFAEFSGIDYAARSIAQRARRPQPVRSSGFRASISLATTAQPHSGKWSG